MGTASLGGPNGDVGRRRVGPSRARGLPLVSTCDGPLGTRTWSRTVKSGDRIATGQWKVYTHSGIYKMLYELEVSSIVLE
jgi:hypothetical protein